MKIVLKEGERDYATTHRLFIDGKESVGIYPLCECPEDAIIGRNLIDGRDIIRYIKMGYDAAKRGEDIEVSIEKDDEEE